MPDIIVLYSKNHCWSGRSKVSIISKAGNVPDIPYGSPLATALRLLLGSGFVIISSDGNSRGFSYTLVRGNHTSGPADYLKGRIGEVLTVETTAGTVSGTLTFVGRDFIELVEPTEDIVLIPITSIVTVS